MTFKRMTLLALFSFIILCLIIPYAGAKGEWEGLTVKEWMQEDQIPRASIIGLKKFQESPDLAKMVKSGKLPPLKDRLPEDPVVVNPVEGIGRYGGTINRVWGPGMVSDADREFIWFGQGLFKMDRKTISYLGPNLVREWEWNKDQTAVTLHFVKGIKWSDGVPLTANDYIWWWENIIMDDMLPYTPPKGYHIAGKPAKFVKIDDYTVRLEYAKPYPFALLDIYSRDYQHIIPAHYFKKFHPRYNKNLKPNEIDGIIARYDNLSRYPDKPVYTAWKLVEYVPEQRMVFERNPYYWKVDRKGNQLPYVDRVVTRYVSDKETALVQALDGKLDFQEKRWDQRDIPLLLKSQKRGGYRIEKWGSGQSSSPVLYPGYSYGDADIRKIMLNTNFRRALSYSINRKMINEQVFAGFAKPRVGLLKSGFGPGMNTPEAKKLVEQWESSWIDYSPKKARQLLDSIGMKDVNGDGWRERPDGKKFQLYVMVNQTLLDIVDAVDLIVESWRQIGIDAKVETVSEHEESVRGMSGDYMMMARRALPFSFIGSNSQVFAPIDTVLSVVDPVQALYYVTDGAKGAPPRSDFFKQLQDLYTQTITNPNTEERNKLSLEIYKLNIQHGPLLIGVVGDHIAPVVVNEKLRNVMKYSMIEAWSWQAPGITNPEHYYYEK